MKTIDQLLKAAVIKRMVFDNPWWQNGRIPEDYAEMPHRSYLEGFFQLMKDTEVKRATLLMGPRRVGKTVMIHHAIERLIAGGVRPRRIIYLSIDTPIYNNLSLEQLFDLAQEAMIETEGPEPFYVIYDEIQYLKDWEIHLKSMVDTYRNAVKFIASGSAAAALKMKSNESGAGRFTDFTLPPLTFPEFLKFKGLQGLVVETKTKDFPYQTMDIERLNQTFLEYINFGGFPEVVFSEKIKRNIGTYVKNDIIDKVLLRDLPSLYGITDIQELNRLFVHIAFRSGSEFSYDNLAQEAGIKKDVLKKYLTYLQAAFLIKVVNRVDQNARHMQRTVAFKIYLTNPSLRSALFTPITENDEEFLGGMIETAVFSQWVQKATEDLYYASWTKGREKGEVDIVRLDPASLKADSVAEVKWTDRYAKDPTELKSLWSFLKQNPKIDKIRVTTHTLHGEHHFGDKIVQFVPTALYAYSIIADSMTKN